MRSSQKCVAIVTPYGTTNFGNRLQNYALQKSFEKLGFAVETLLIRRSYFKSLLRKIVSETRRRIMPETLSSQRYSQFMVFEMRVRSRWIWTRTHLKWRSRKYDFFVFGSDQIWNPHHIDFFGAEFGTFLERNQFRFSLAASFGIDELPEARKDLASKALSQFKAISVREFQGAAIVKELINRDAEVLIDPTMSLTRPEWEAVASDRLIPGGDYALVYLLGDYDESLWKSLEGFAKQKNLTLVKMLDISEPEIYSAGPQDFVGLISRASFVLTDSFHAVIFSCLFGVSVAIINRPGEFSMSSRFQTLDRHFEFTYEPTPGISGARTLVFWEEDFHSKLSELRTHYWEFIDRALRDSSKSND